MKKKFVQKTIDSLQKKKKLTNIEEKRLRYGLEGFYNLITKFVVIFGFAIIFGFLKELLLLMFIYSLLRLYGFGIHAKKSWQCWLTTLPVYIGGCYFIRYGVLAKEIVSVIWILGLLSFIFFAPADTASRPLIHKEKRVRAKVLALLIYICLYIVNIYYPSQELINATMLAIIMQSIVMNPLTYRICHAPYKNYKKYVKAV